MKKRLEITIFGSVQGVFFRQSTEELANKLNLTGWIKNQNDGTVKVVAEGPEKNLKKLLEFCHQGPSSAQVDQLEEKWTEAKNEFKDFTTHYD